MCFLKTNVTTITQNDLAIAAYRPELEPQIKISAMKFFANTEFIGKVIEPKSDMKYVDCLMRCEKQAECQGFSHMSKLLFCRLLRSVEQQRPNGAMASARKIVR